MALTKVQIKTKNKNKTKEPIHTTTITQQSTNKIKTKKK